MRKKLLLIAGIFTFLLFVAGFSAKAVITITPDANGILYVNKSVSGGGHDGSSWTDAMPELADALKWARENQTLWTAQNPLQIWVAGGTYQPLYRADNMSGNNPAGRNNAFVLVKDVKVYGGFAGTETSLEGRDLSLIANQTTLSGDFNNDDVVTGTGSSLAFTGNGENAYHVVISVGDVGTAVLNGFTISGGNANDVFNSITVNLVELSGNAGGGVYNSSSSPVLSNLTISSNTALSGGGMCNASSSPILTNVTISSNYAGYDGGGMYNSLSSPVLTKVTISSNTVVYSGGGMSNNSSSSPVLTNVTLSSNSASGGGGMSNNSSSSPVLTNVTISSNTASIGGGMYNYYSSSPQIRNSIVWGNDIFNSSSIPNYSYSIVQGTGNGWSTFGTDAGNNLDADPMFSNAAGGDYTLQPGSPAINAGNNSLYEAGKTPDLSGITTDLAGNARIQKGNVDIGAYESAYSPNPVPNANGILYVNKSVSGGKQNGNSWTDALPELADALKAAKEQNTVTAGTIKQIWVAGGTYQPLYRADDMSGTSAKDRDNAFVLVKDVKVYGGFAGTETSLEGRDLSLTANKTTLSGDFNNDDVVTGSGSTLAFAGNGENAYHVVISVGDVGTTELNGFTISGGNANVYNSITVNSVVLYLYDGGGMYNTASSSPVLTNVIISNNTASNGGGGMCNHSSSPVLTNVTIISNTAIYGGGMYNYSSSPILTNVTISSNTASYGGGMCNSSSSPVLTNVVISSNTASFGGGMYNDFSSPVLTNVTISSNTASGEGGGMYNSSSSSPQIRNSIVWGNDIFNISSSIPNYSYSIVQGTGNGWSTFGTDAGNNLDADPLFTNAVGGDYTLQPGSPAINAGNNSLYEAGKTPDLSGITTDLAGNARINGTIDMGAYEYEGTLPVALLSFIATAETGGVKLSWQTASEENNKSFSISRSTDGINFITIATVDGKGLSSSLSDYTFLDRMPESGLNYYRLLQTDFDGKTTDLGIRPVSFQLNEVQLSVYPNPTENLLNLKFDSGVFSHATLIELSGKVLQEQAIDNLQTQAIFNLESYSSGTYFIRLTGQGNTIVRKVIKF